MPQCIKRVTDFFEILLRNDEHALLLRYACKETKEKLEKKFFKIDLSTLISRMNRVLRLFFLGKKSRPYAVIKDPEKLCENWKKIGYFQRAISG